MAFLLSILSLLLSQSLGDGLVQTAILPQRAVQSMVATHTYRTASGNGSYQTFPSNSLIF